VGPPRRLRRWRRRSFVTAETLAIYCGCWTPKTIEEVEFVGYQLEGSILEVCDCNVLCPCWVGENADNGTCDAIVAYNVEKGTVNGTDVSGLTIAILGHIPGNILQGNWRIAVFMDEKASQQQEDALMQAFTGKLGGPLADLAKLIGEVLTVQRAPITFEVKEGEGTLKVGAVAEAVMAPYRGATGEVTKISDSVFSTIPGSPAFLSKASKYRRKSSGFGLRDMDLQNHNAIQGSFRFAA
jgi:hypothetical protein